MRSFRTEKEVWADNAREKKARQLEFKEAALNLFSLLHKLRTYTLDESEQENLESLRMYMNWRDRIDHLRERIHDGDAPELKECEFLQSLCEDFENKINQGERQ